MPLLGITNDGIICKINDGQHLTSGTPGGSVRVFLLRRATRILPLYWGAVLLVWAARNPGLPGNWRDLLEHLTFTQVFDSERIFYTIGPAWSLSVEVWFYLFLALLYGLSNTATAAALSHRSRRVAAWGVPVALIIAGTGWNLWEVYLAHEPATRWAVWFNPLAKAPVFGIGMIIAVIETGRRNRVLSPVKCGLLRATAVALLVLGAIPRTDESSTVLTFSILSTIAFGVLIATSVMGEPESRYRRALAAPSLTWLGLISYSLYMWHEPVLLFLDAHLSLDHAPGMFPVTAVLLLTVSIPVAIASYHVIERPFARLRHILRNDGTLSNLYEPERLNPLQNVPR